MFIFLCVCSRQAHLRDRRLQLRIELCLVLFHLIVGLITRLLDTSTLLCAFTHDRVSLLTATTSTTCTSC